MPEARVVEPLADQLHERVDRDERVLDLVGDAGDDPGEEVQLLRPALLHGELADAVVDLVETGSTLAANRLRVLTDIGLYETMLVQNREQRYADIAETISNAAARYAAEVRARTFPGAEQTYQPR